MYINFYSIDFVNKKKKAMRAQQNISIGTPNILYEINNIRLIKRDSQFKQFLTYEILTGRTSVEVGCEMVVDGGGYSGGVRGGRVRHKGGRHVMVSQSWGRFTIAVFLSSVRRWFLFWIAVWWRRSDAGSYRWCFHRCSCCKLGSESTCEEFAINLAVFLRARVFHFFHFRNKPRWRGDREIDSSLMLSLIVRIRIMMVLWVVVRVDVMVGGRWRGSTAIVVPSTATTGTASLRRRTGAKSAVSMALNRAQMRVGSLVWSVRVRYGRGSFATTWGPLVTWRAAVTYVFVFGTLSRTLSVLWNCSKLMIWANFRHYEILICTSYKTHHSQLFLC